MTSALCNAFRSGKYALAGVTQQAAGSVPGQGASKRQPIDVSLPPHPLPLSLKLINMSLGEVFFLIW